MTLLKVIANESLAENAKLKAEIERLRAAIKEALGCGDNGDAMGAVLLRATGIDPATGNAIEQSAQPSNERRITRAEAEEMFPPAERGD